MELKSYNLAEVVNDLKEVIQYDINFISTDGVILYSTNSNRIGTYHHVGKLACEKGKTIKVFDNDDAHGVKSGINSPIVVNHNIIGCIGMTGHPKDLEQYQTITKKLTERYIQAQLYVQDVAKSKKLNMKIITEIKNRESLLLYYSDLMAKGLTQNTDMCTIVVSGLSDIESQSLLREHQSVYLCADLDSKFVLFVDRRNVEQIRKKFFAKNEERLKMVIGPTVQRFNLLWYSLEQALITLETTSKKFADINKPSLDILIANEYKFNKNYYLEVVLAKFEEKLSPKKREQILEVFLTYVECNRSISLASSNLHISESTLKYQLKKLFDVVDIENNFEGQVLLYTALKIYEIENLRAFKCELQ